MKPRSAARACKGGGTQTAGKKEQFLALEQRSEPMVDGGGGNAPKLSTLVVQKHK
jgi:hypothetical protein